MHVVNLWSERTGLVSMPGAGYRREQREEDFTDIDGRGARPVRSCKVFVTPKFDTEVAQIRGGLHGVLWFVKDGIVGDAMRVLVTREYPDLEFQATGQFCWLNAHVVVIPAEPAPAETAAYA